MYVCVCTVRIYLRMYVCSYILCMYVCMYVYMYVCMYVRMNVCTCDLILKNRSICHTYFFPEVLANLKYSMHSGSLKVPYSHTLLTV